LTELRTHRERPHDLIRTMLGVIALGGLLGLSFWIMRPFLGPLLWATTIVIATWPVLVWLQERLWNRRWMAVTVMSLMLTILFVVPFVAAIGTIVSNVDEIAGWAKLLATIEIPAAPDWVAGLPLVGEKAAITWNQLADEGRGALAKKVAPYAGQLARWFASEVGSFGAVAIQFLMTLAIAPILYATGETAARGVRLFARRLAGEQGDGAVKLAAGAIRGVALGVVLTALIQSVVGGIGLAVCGVPFAGLLTAVMFMLAVAQIGPIPVLVPAIIWLWYTGHPAAAVVLAVFTVVVGTMDNFIRPVLIRRGADLPLLLIFAGVIGGLIAFGLVGIFIGPVVLAITFTLISAWVNGRAEPHVKFGTAVAAAGEPAADASVVVSTVPVTAPTPPGPQPTPRDPAVSPGGGASPPPAT
jgi:predicted PurR-regulated permease PerM